MQYTPGPRPRSGCTFDRTFIQPASRTPNGILAHAQFFSITNGCNIWRHCSSRIIQQLVPSAAGLFQVLVVSFWNFARYFEPARKGCLTGRTDYVAASTTAAPVSKIISCTVLIVTATHVILPFSRILFPLCFCSHDRFAEFCCQFFVHAKFLSTRSMFKS